MSDTKEARTETNVVIQADDREEEILTDLQSEAPYKRFFDDVRIGDFENCANDSIGQDGTVSSDESSGSAAARAEIFHDEYDADNLEINCEKPESDPSQKGKKVDVMSVEHLLGSLLTCGSHRLSAMMYKVVRKLLVPKKCYLCGTLGKCTRLPGMTAIKSNAKPMSKDWYAKHDLLQLTVDENGAGAETLS